MAYNNAPKSSNFQGNAAGAATTAKKPVLNNTTGGAEASTLFTTGMFRADKGPALATVRTKEEITIPAGAYINLYEVDEDKKTETGPVYRLQIRKVEPKA